MTWGKRKSDNQSYVKKTKKSVVGLIGSVTPSTGHIKLATGTSIQSVLFSKKKFDSKSEVKQKAKQLGFKTKKIETKPKWNWYRVRQVNPSQFKEHGMKNKNKFAIITLNKDNSIKATVGKRK